MTPGIKKEHPQGMVLLFVLGVLALLMILAATIFMTTQDEVQVSAENFTSREAFTKADLTSRVGVYLARTTLYGSPGEISETLAGGGVAGRPEFVVNVRPNFGTNDFLEIGDKVTNEQILERYVLAADASPSAKPHVEVYYQYDNNTSKRQLIGTAAVAIGTGASDGLGSQGEGQYDQIATGGYSVRAFLVVSANGRVPYRTKDSTLPVDPSNYFTGAGNAKHSIVTTIYQEIMQ